MDTAQELSDGEDWSIRYAKTTQLSLSLGLLACEVKWRHLWEDGQAVNLGGKGLHC